MRSAGVSPAVGGWGWIASRTSMPDCRRPEGIGATFFKKLNCYRFLILGGMHHEKNIVNAFCCHQCLFRS